MFSNLKTLSQTVVVDFLCDIRIIVLSLQFSLIDFKISPSFNVSKLLVGSSKIKISPSLKNALARPILCFSPEDNLPPSSPTFVSYPLGNVSIKSCIEAFLAAFITSSFEALRLPTFIFSKIDSLNK